MSSYSGRSWIIGMVTICLPCFAGIASAEPLVFQMKAAESVLHGGLFIRALDVFAGAQDANDVSVNASWTGSLTVDVDDINNPTSITFVSSEIKSQDTGDWLPDSMGGDIGTEELWGDANQGDPEPAAYGWYLDAGDVGQLWGASRNTTLSLVADAKPVSSGQFNPFGITVNVLEGLFNSNVSSPIFGDSTDVNDITDEIGQNCTLNADPLFDRCGGAMASYVVDNNEVTLTIPMDFLLGEGDGVEASFKGTFVATASLGGGVDLLGDYNKNGVVDAADYTVWKDNFGSTSALDADGNGNGTVDAADYTIWKDNFGNIAGAAANVASVPEPSSIAIALLSLLFGYRLRCQRR
ncbi:MAG: hypothetical protein R3E01_06605 [Pirellulaceae bacterium]